MNTVNPISPSWLSLRSEQAPQWAHIQRMISQQRITPAMILCGPLYLNLVTFMQRATAAMLCQSEDGPCGECSDCHLFRVGTHPDVLVIKPETDGSVIKIDQVRVLQQDVYQTPTRAQRRIIAIEAADKMNTAAANALLKILEEPPAYVHFMLTAEQLGTMPATIISRCQILHFSDAVTATSRYFSQGEHYAPDTERAQLHEQRLEMIRMLDEMVDGSISPCTIATRYAKYNLANVVWLLYLIIAQTLRCRVLANADLLDTEKDIITRFAHRFHPMLLIKQLDRINAIVTNVNRTIPINTTLALEAVLIGFLTGLNHDGK